jgi:tetrapyrrole methylase family protein/MazG family protein
MTEKNQLERLIEIMEILRSDRGCPWDREQTHTSIAANLLEEAYEVYEAIMNQDDEHLKEELGDLLLQIIFHAQIARERKAFDIYEIARKINEKLIRRHPHVFGDIRVDTSKEVLRRWEEIKKNEREAREEGGHALDSLPKSMPSLLLALNAQKKASRLGFDWKEPEPVLEKLDEELKELRETYDTFRKDPRVKEELEEEIGDVLFAAVNFARLAGIDPEYSLRKVTEKFITRVKLVEEFAQKEGVKLSEASLEDLDRLWEKAKEEIKNNKKLKERGDE